MGALGRSAGAETRAHRIVQPSNGDLGGPNTEIPKTLHRHRRSTRGHRYPQVGPLEHSDARLALVRPAEAEGVSFDGDAVYEILTAA